MGVFKNEINTVKLELYEKKATERVCDHPVLFLHGAGFSAQCWDRFLGYFAAAGYDAYAVSLRGHGESESCGALSLTGSSAFIEDIRSTVERIGGQPIMIGHSWGGYLLQRYLEQYDDCAYAVLMASAPPATSLPAYWRMFKMFPWLVTVAHLTARPHYVYHTEESVRQLLYYEGMSVSEVRNRMKTMEPISVLLYLQSIFRAPKPDRMSSKMMIVGGGADVIYTPQMVSATASVYGVEPVIIEDACHMMMDDPTWRETADQILNWIRSEAVDSGH